MSVPSRPPAPWGDRLASIHRRMAGVTEEEVLAALRADELDETAGTSATVVRREQERAQTAATPAVSLHLRMPTEHLTRRGSASTLTP